jgi:hypothetical protein
MKTGHFPDIPGPPKDDKKTTFPPGGERRPIAAPPNHFKEGSRSLVTLDYTFYTLVHNINKTRLI